MIIMKTCSAIVLSFGLLLSTTITTLAQWESNDEYQTLKKQTQKAVVNSLKTQPDSCKMRYILLDFRLGKGQKLDSVVLVTNIAIRDAALMKSKLDTIKVNWQSLLSKKQMKNSAIMMPIVINDVSDYCQNLTVSGAEIFTMVKAMTEPTQNKTSKKTFIFFPTLEVEYSHGK